MKSIALLDVDEAAELLKRLKKEAIPVEIQAVAQKGGLDCSNILVEDRDYERACNIADSWNAEPKVSPSKVPISSRPKWMRIGFRVLSVLLFLAAIWIFIRGFKDAEAGNVQIVHTSKGLQYASNREFKLSFVLILGATVCFGLSMPNDKKDDKTSA
jgi:hypothetical protein